MSNRVWWTVFGLLLIVTVGTRFYKLDQPDHVWYYSVTRCIYPPFDSLKYIFLVGMKRTLENLVVTTLTALSFLTSIHP